jgi:membrane-bound serine protease (ClpP class)
MKNMIKAWRRCIYIGMLLFTLTPAILLAQGQKVVLTMKIDGAVTPAMLSFISRGIDNAQNRQAEALIIQLNTPGGDVDLTKRIIQQIIDADIPVVVYVYPSGGYAASAGTLITLAGHAAAMAPNTSIGAASPISANPQSGQAVELPETLKAKVENILVADIEGLASRRGEKALEWARQAITEARAATAEQALELGVVDFIAKNPNDLLNQLDGFTVTVHGQARTLHTAGLALEEITPNFSEEFLQTISNPNIAFLLLSLGTTALILELSAPGGYVAGVIGAIMLILAFYSLGTLPVNYAGLILIVLAFVLFIADIKAPTHGVLTISGIISFALGATILFNTPLFQVSMSLILGISLTLGAFFAFIVSKGIAIQYRRPATGMESLVGKTATARTALSPYGTVFLFGERWEAALQEGTAQPGDQVEVIGSEGMRLVVRKKAH